MGTINCISINHTCAPVEIRERVRVKPGDMRTIMDGGSETFTLNTCNRTEVYWTAISTDKVYDLMAHLSGIDNEMLKNASRYFVGREAVKHLFMVASGLDSLVIGEPQILGQVKDSHREALASNTTSTIMNKALHRAFRASKLVRTQTEIGNYPGSVASEAVEVAAHVFGDISHGRVLVIGAGDMASRAAKRLVDRGVKNLVITNRTYGTAIDLARELGVTARPFEYLSHELAMSDIVITATKSPHPIITKRMVEKAMKARNRPLIIVDIGVPRDVDPDARGCCNCYLYDIDALKTNVDRNYSHRKAEAEKAISIIEAEVDKFEKEISILEAQTTIKDLISLVDTYIEDQIGLMSVPEGEKEVMRKRLRSPIQRLLNRPVSFLKENPDSMHIECIRRIFQLNWDYQDRHKR